jgi:23S rRNA pseudouridine1911/1915/1917 synthase
MSALKQVRTETGIVHFRLDRRMSLSAFLMGADFTPLQVAPDRALVEEWLHYGSVYVDGVRRREDLELEPGQVLRVHTRRKNYVTGTELKKNIAADFQEFLVLDKPAGVPTHATLDNYVDNAQFRLSLELGSEVLVTHRLDIATQGLLILAKNKGAQAALNKAFMKGRVKKTYRAITVNRVPLGLHTHYINPETKVPRAISTDAAPGWWECKLEVLRSEKHELGFWSEIRLLTGKTHQIRAQLAALGTPILGDSTYGSAAPFPNKQSAFEQSIALECYALEFPFRNQELGFRRPHSIASQP